MSRHPHCATSVRSQKLNTRSGTPRHITQGRNLANTLKSGTAKLMLTNAFLDDRALRALAQESAELGGQLAMAEENCHRLCEKVRGLGSD